MTLIEERRNIFELDPKKYYFAHCISSDCKMGAGIAVDFKKKFGLSHLTKLSPLERKNPSCYHSGRVFNLITKKHYYGKPTYESLTTALEDMKSKIIAFNVKFLAIPKLACGLDKLQWGKVREIIQEVFKDVDVEIRVCYL